MSKEARLIIFYILFIGVICLTALYTFAQEIVANDISSFTNAMAIDMQTDNKYQMLEKEFPGKVTMYYDNFGNPFYAVDGVAPAK